MSKHILIVSQYFYPEQFRINDMCEEWVKKGYKVTVLTGIPNYPYGKFFEGFGIFKNRKQNYKGADVIRIPIVPRGNNALMLALNYLSFVVSGLIWCLFTKVKADRVFIFEVSPMSQALPGVWYAKKRKIPCYLYVQDLWPENVEIITGISNRYIIGSIGKMVDYIYARCDKIFTTSRSFIQSISSRGISKEKLEYWPQYAEDFYMPLHKLEMPQIQDEEKLQVTFTGNIGFAQGLEVLPKAAKILKNNDLTKIKFNIVGDGRFKDDFIELINRENVREMFNLIDRQPAEKIPQLLAASDVAFLSLSKSPLFEMTIPAKLQSYMACGIPILGSVDGEASRIIKDSKSGLSSPSGDEVALAENLKNLIELSNTQLKDMAINSRDYYDKHFNKQKLLNHMDMYLGQHDQEGKKEVV